MHMLLWLETRQCHMLLRARPAQLVTERPACEKGCVSIGARRALAQNPSSRLRGT